ncbi:MAG: PAS domain S-box protein [Acidobacteriota bacterium]
MSGAADTRWQRERRARKRAEELLREKARELSIKNEQLERLNESLEDRVRRRTQELVSANTELTRRTTELERAERFLQLTQEAMDHAGEAIFWLDSDGKITYANRSAHRSLGHAPNALVGMTVFDIDELMTRDMWAPHWEELKQERNLTLESVHLDADGQRIPVEVSVNYIQHRSEELNCAFVRDIRERKAAEARLRAREAEARQLSLVASRTTNAVIITDSAGRIEWVNDGFQRLTGFAFDEVKGRTPGSVLQGPGTNPATIDEMRELLKGGRGFSREVLNYGKDGTPYWVEIEVQPVLDELGIIEHFVAIETEITERKLGELRLERLTQLREMVERTESAFLDVSPLAPTMGQFMTQAALALDLDRAWCAWIAPTGARTSWQRTGIGIESGQLNERERHALQTWAASGGSHQDVHVSSGRGPRQQDRSILVTDTTAFVIIPVLVRGELSGMLALESTDPVDWDDEVVGLLARTALGLGRSLERQLADDEIRAAAEGMEKALLQAQKASEAKSNFLANMSHEIRTPMTAIVGQSEILARGDLDADERAYWARQVQRNADYLLGLLNDVLDLSKIEAGQVEAILGECSLTNLVAEVMSLVRPRATEAALELELELSAPLPDRVVTDELRLRQILMNLLTNAIKFTKEGSVKLSLECTSLGKRSVRLQFAVADTGVGISAEDQTKLFKPFVQAEDGRPAVAGTGLGLTISRRFARMLGGDIELASEPGSGSVFTTTCVSGLPDGVAWLDETTFRDVDTRHDDDDVAARVMRLDGIHIHVTDDNPQNRQILTFLLEESGCVVTTSEDGEEACTEILRRRDGGDLPDLVLMDMQMPRLNGYQATRKLRDEGLTELPIVALTAYAMAGDREKCLEAGCDDYLTKPVLPGTMRRLIAKKLSLQADYSEPTPPRSPSQSGPDADAAPTTRAAPSSTTTASASCEAPKAVLSPEEEEARMLAELLAPLRAEYVAYLAESLEKLETAWSERDDKTVMTTAHQLRGNASNHGFIDVAKHAGELEDALRHDRPEDVAETAARDLLSALTTAVGDRATSS